MKNLLFIALFAIVSVAHAIVLSPGSGTYVDATGTVVNYDKVWIIVKSATAIARGKVVYPDLTADDGYTVTTTAPQAGNKALCVTDEAIAAGGTGLCLVRGKHDAVYFEPIGGVNLTAGYPIYGSGTTVGYSYAITGASVTYQTPIGVGLDASSATGTVDAYISL